MSSFQQIAETVADKTTELLDAPTSVIDERGFVVASSKPTLVGRPLEFPAESDDFLRVPLQLETGAGEVVVSQSVSGEIVSPRLARALVELTINQAIVVDRLPNKSELKNKLIHNLLFGTIGDEASTLREAQILGMNLSLPRAVILVDAAQYILDGRAENPATEAQVRRRAQVIIGSIVDFFQLPTDTICAYIGQGEVVVLKASNRQNLQDWVSTDDGRDMLSHTWADLDALKGAAAALLPQLRAHARASITIGVGRHHLGLGGLARSYQDAGAALRLGKRFFGTDQVHCLDSLGVAAFVGIADEATKVDLATYLLRPLDDEPELLQTLTAFFEHDLSPCQATAELSIHRNTLTYRLDKITSLIGLDPRHFNDAVQIQLSLVLRSLSPGTPRETEVKQPPYAAR